VPSIMGLEMGEILFKCPHTLKSVRTGLKSEWVVLHSLPPVAIPILCAACGQMHEWKRKDAWVGQAAEFRTAPEGPAVSLNAKRG
jgi:hypothetical protein